MRCSSRITKLFGEYSWVGTRMMIAGVQSYPVAVFRDPRGVLACFEPGMNLPFPMRRYFVLIPKMGAVRAEHSSTAHELIAVLSGSLHCDVDNGAQKQTFLLEAGGPGLWLHPGVWLRLRDFGAETVVGVASSLTFAETRQSQAPMPDILAEALGLAAFA